MSMGLSNLFIEDLLKGKKPELGKEKVRKLYPNLDCKVSVK